jgi:hypothetical protein
MVAAWMVVIAAAGLAEPWHPAAVLAGCLALLGAGYAVFVWSPRARPWCLLAPMILGSLVLARLEEVGGLVGYPMLALWLNLTTLTMGILLPMRRAAVGGVAVVAATMMLVWQAHVAQAVPLGRSALLSVGAIALAVGMLVAVPAGMLRRTAQEGDALAVAAIGAAVDAAILEGRRGELRRVQRILHDTVMNTLGAVARLDADDRASVAERCAADLVILRRAEWAAVDDPSVVLESVARRAHLLGVDLDVSAPDPGPALPAGVAAAVEGATWESLNNISKHVRDRRAFLDWSWDGRAGHLRLTDAGPGVDGLSWTRGGEESIVRRCAEAGITAQIRSASGSGTVVDLAWGGATFAPGASAPDADSVQPPRALDQLFAETLTRVCMVVVTLGLVATLALPGTLPRWSSLVGVLGVAGLGGCSWAVQRGRARWLVPAVAYPTVALLGTWSTGIGQEGCARVGSWWWGSLVGIVICVAAILMDGRRRVALASALGFVAGNALVAWGLGPGASACHPDVVVDSLVGLAGLAGLWAFRRHLIQTWALAAHQQQALVHERARVAAAEEAVQARQAMLGFARSVAEPVLVGLAEGTLDPGDPATRARAAHAEGVLRALMAVPVADPGGAGQALTGLVLAAHERGLELRLHLSADLDQAPELVRAGSAMLARALDLCPPGACVMVTVLQSGNGLQGLLLIGVPRGPDPRSALVADLAGEGWSVTVVGDDILAEARWEDRA